VDIPDLLRFVNAQHGTSFELRGYLEGGTRGAWEIAEPNGRRAVLKRGWGEHLGRIRPLLEQLRARGYPAPDIFLGGRTPDGGSYYVQSLVPGSPIDRLTPGLLRQIMALIELQADLHPDTDQDQSNYVRNVVFHGESGWPEALRAHSHATAELLTAIERTTHPFASTQLPVIDAVHGDLGASNVLAHNGQVTAVIDIAQVGRGTRIIDLAILLGQEYEDLDGDLRDDVYARMMDISGRGTTTICVAYQIINLVAYAIAKHPPESLPRYVDRGHHMLHDLKRL